MSFLYEYDITRYGEISVTVERNEYTENEKDIMAFYNTEITAAHKQLIIEGFNNEEIADTFNYIKDNLIDRPSSKPPCTYKELMGDCQFFEGISKESNGHYGVILGS